MSIENSDNTESQTSGKRADGGEAKSVLRDLARGGQLPKTDLTETTETGAPAVPTTEQKKSDAASRILRAVERSRGGTTAQIQIPVVEPPAPDERPVHADTAGPEAVSASPSGQGVDAGEALRSLSESQALGQPPEQAETPASQPAEAAADPQPKAAETTVPNPGKIASAIKNSKTQAKAEKPVPAVENSPATAAGNSGGDRSRPEGVSKGTPAFEAPVLGMGPNPRDSFWANLPMVVKAGVAVLVIGMIAGFLFKFSGQTPNGSGAQQPVKSGPSWAPMSGAGGWTSSWGDPAAMNGRSISLFRPSAQHADYRIEFEAQIENKAFGWVFRAKDPQNYYGYKVETVKPGLQPLVALARVMMVAGVESQKHYTLIEAPVRVDTVFRVKMDCVGSEFTTYINGQLVEVWQDDRLRMGGVGLFSDPGERAQVRKVQIFETR
jgi:hypothetical protein